MNKDAKRLPKDQNVKLYIRHSIRYDNPVNGDYTKLLLTPEGIEAAKTIGKSIDKKIGFCGSSSVKRCNQTIQYILEAMPQGLKENAKIETLKTLAVMKGNPNPKEMGGCGWYEYYHYLQERVPEKTGGVTLEEEVKPILDCIFSHGGMGNTLEIFCSHDSHVVMLASALFDFKTGIQEHDNWCKYTEGLFFYGTRERFTSLWRGEERQFDNYLL